MAKQDKDPGDKQSQLAQAEKEYRQIKRMLKISLIVILGLVIALVLTRPGGYLPFVIFLVLVEAISYPFFTKSLDKRRAERVAQIESNS